jgi:hypothetical protein
LEASPLRLFAVQNLLLQHYNFSYYCTKMIPILIFLIYCCIAPSRYTSAQYVDSAAGSKLEVLPDTARVVPGHYVAIFADTIEVSDFVEAMPVDDYNEPILMIRYMYNNTPPSATVPLRGVAVSNAYGGALEWLLESDLVVSVTPVCNTSSENIEGTDLRRIASNVGGNVFTVNSLCHLFFLLLRIMLSI